MTSQEKISYKLLLRKFALDAIGERIAAARLIIDQVQQAANQEEKSSAGDKYETGRAMGHLQKDMYARQLAENTRELGTLHAVQTDTIYETAGPGALVVCPQYSIFIAAGLGKHQVDGRTILFVSPQAPLARLLLTHRKGDILPFSGSNLVIEDVF